MLKQFLQSKFIFPLAIAIGVAITLVMNKSAPPMAHQDAEERAVPVTYVEAHEHSVRPSIIGFGEVEPDVLLNTLAEVSGRVIQLDSSLRKGNILASGAQVVMIDQKDYLLALKQAEADLAKNEANLKELRLNAEDMKVDLALAEEKLSLGEGELKRIETLLEKSSASRSMYDNQKTAVLQLKQEVQNLKSQLETLPAQIEVQEAQIDISKANIATQEHNLDRTILTLPFAARIIDVYVEEGQFVGQGTQLFSAQTIDKVAVEAQFPLDQFQVLAKGFGPAPERMKQAFINGDSETIFASLGLSAKVYLSGDSGPVWDANFERITGSLDPSSRTLGVVVSVDQPYRDVNPGSKPPLIKGMYTEVALEGRAKNFFVVPRDALHNGQLYIIKEGDQLQRITPEYQIQGSMLLVEGGLEPGAQVVTSDLFPAVPGMKLKPNLDSTRAGEIEAWVAGQVR
jgi:multidrug efflux pump subunit AcrA (membrane-fusion protein)